MVDFVQNANGTDWDVTAAAGTVTVTDIEAMELRMLLNTQYGADTSSTTDAMAPPTGETHADFVSRITDALDVQG